MYLEPRQRPIWWNVFVKIVKGEKPLNVSQKNSVIYISEGSNYASLAVSLSCIVNKITCEDTEAEVLKYFFRKCFANFPRKTPVLESHFEKVAGPQACNFIKKSPTQVFSCKFCEIFKRNLFCRTPPVAAF